MNAHAPMPEAAQLEQPEGTQAPDLLHSLLTGPRTAPAEARELDLEVDGRSVTVRAEHRLVLRCGEAAIVLHADGRIELRGTYITSQASATQRIVGGSVDVN